MKRIDLITFRKLRPEFKTEIFNKQVSFLPYRVKWGLSLSPCYPSPTYMNKSHQSEVPNCHLFLKLIRLCIQSLRPQPLSWPMGSQCEYLTHLNHALLVFIFRFRCLNKSIYKTYDFTLCVYASTEKVVPWRILIQQRCFRRAGIPSIQKMC